MRIVRDFSPKIENSLPVKILKGPRQVGKTTFLLDLPGYEIVYLDDAATRDFATTDPRLFLDQLPKKIILDEAGLSPPLFPEIKRRVDEERRLKKKEIDYWITSSNQTILSREVGESLAGRASYFDLNTLSIHELGERYQLGKFLLKGGWPELYVSENLDQVRYLNDLISTFVEKDLVAAAGIEKRAGFLQVLRLVSARVGQLFNASEVASLAHVELTTVKSWLSIFEQNGVLRELKPYYTNLNKRLIKSSKWYFEDVSFATRLQGWSELQPLLVSPTLGQLIENIAVQEVVRYFLNKCQLPELYYVRSKEKVEVDLLVKLSNQKWLAVEIKSQPQDLTNDQYRLLDSLNLNIQETWIVTPGESSRNYERAKVVPFKNIWDELSKF